MNGKPTQRPQGLKLTAGHIKGLHVHSAWAQQNSLGKLTIDSLTPRLQEPSRPSHLIAERFLKQRTSKKRKRKPGQGQDSSVLGFKKCVRFTQKVKAHHTHQRGNFPPKRSPNPSGKLSHQRVHTLLQLLVKSVNQKSNQSAHEQTSEFDIRQPCCLVLEKSLPLSISGQQMLVCSFFTLHTVYALCFFNSMNMAGSIRLRRFGRGCGTRTARRSRTRTHAGTSRRSLLLVARLGLRSLGLGLFLCVALGCCRPFS